jgi:hypothetical protein
MPKCAEHLHLSKVPLYVWANAAVYVIVNVTELLFCPLGLVTEMLCAPRTAFEAIIKLAVVKVLDVFLRFVTVIPVGTFIPTFVKPVPEIDIPTVCPCAPDVGEMDAISGAGPAVIWKPIELLLPPPKLTETRVFPTEADGEMEKVVEIEVELLVGVPTIAIPSPALILAGGWPSLIPPNIEGAPSIASF